MSPWSKVAPCVLFPISLMSASAGCVAGAEAGTSESDVRTTAAAQFEGLPPPGPVAPVAPVAPIAPPVGDTSAVVNLLAVCPSVPPDDPLWPICQTLCVQYGLGDCAGYGDYGYGAYGGYGADFGDGRRFGGGHFEGSGGRHDGGGAGHWSGGSASPVGGVGDRLGGDSGGHAGGADGQFGGAGNHWSGGVSGPENLGGGDHHHH